MGVYPSLGDISISHNEPPFASSDPSTGYNINDMFSMGSVYSICQKSRGNRLHCALLLPILTIFPHCANSLSASQHPMSHPLPPATPVLDITLTTCSPWVLCTPFAINPVGID